MRASHHFVLKYFAGLLHILTAIQLHSHSNASIPRLHHELHVTRTDFERENVRHNGVHVRISRKHLQEWIL